MEDNQVALRGSKSAWVKDCKEQVFQDSPDVTIERIGVKHNNLKASWTAGRKKLDGTGYGSREGGTIMGELEKKFPFFKRLDKIFGTRPNACLGTSLDTITVTPAASSQRSQPRTSVLESSPGSPHTPSIESSQSPNNTQRSGTQRSGTQHSETERSEIQHSEEDTDEETDDSESESFTWNVPSISPVTPSPVTPASSQLPKNKGLQSSPPTPSRYSTSKRKAAHRMDPMMKILEERGSQELEREIKRAKVEQEMQKERLEAEYRRFRAEKDENRILQTEKLEAEERLARISASTATQIAKIQADAQIRQFEFIARIFGHRKLLEEDDDL